MSSHRLLALGLLTVLAGTGVPGASSAQPGRDAGSPAPDSLRQAWSARIGTTNSLNVRHVEARQQPVPFKSRVPSFYALSYVHAEGTLEGPGARALARMLAEALAAAGAADCKGGCADSALANDEIEMGFLSGGDTIRVSVSSRLPRIMAQTAHPATFTCFGGPVLFHAVVETLSTHLPDDLRLATVLPCVELATPPDLPGIGMVTAVETFPEVIRKVTAQYPESSRREGIEATVFVRALIDREGRVRRTLLDGTTYDLRPFQRNAVDAVEQWRFKPATSAGKPVPVWVMVPIRFVLQ